MDTQTAPTETTLTTWCIRTESGNRRVILAGEHLPRVHHDRTTGLMFLVASGHRWGVRAGCACCFPAPLPESVTVTALPPGTAACTACVIRTATLSDGVPTADAEYVMVPDNGRDGMSACTAHRATVQEAILDHTTDDESWEALVEHARCGEL